MKPMVNTLGCGNKGVVVVYQREVPEVRLLLRMRGSRGERGPGPPPLENHKTIELHSNIGPDLLETKPAFNVEPSSTRQLHSI